jgi:hypothetical protein
MIVAARLADRIGGARAARLAELCACAVSCEPAPDLMAWCDLLCAETGRAEPRRDDAERMGKEGGAS